MLLFYKSLAPLLLSYSWLSCHNKSYHKSVPFAYSHGNDYYRRNNIAKNHILAIVEPSVENISEVLNIKTPITQEHLNLCQKIVENSFSVPLPTPRTGAMGIFSQQVGPENTKDPKKIVSGCYKLFLPGIDESYVGQSINLNRRVKDHAKRTDGESTNKWIALNRDKIYVQIYVLPVGLDLRGMERVEFLSVLEQYLFYTEAPTVNKVFVATRGVLHSDKDLLKFREKRGTKTYVYHKKPEGEVLVYVFESQGMVGPIFGFGSRWVLSLKRFSSTFRDTLVFKDSHDPKIPVERIALEDLKALINNTIKFGSKKRWVPIRVTDTLATPPNVVEYPSITAAKAVLNCDDSVFIRNRNRLYKRRYKIEML
uniref:GIY-YIG domain-containing protein n=1 Tax=Microbotryum lychnidis-dioicae TaxID=288795 RepID=M1GLW8_9BASI|nr:hypothetical protein H911_mgp06 [Microbotryum lychnidis-dioicae]AGE14612.1 hypothetical protein [Microbotryum lychnidis-dioicae]